MAKNRRGGGAASPEWESGFPGWKTADADGPFSLELSEAETLLEHARGIIAEQVVVETGKDGRGQQFGHVAGENRK